MLQRPSILLFPGQGTEAIGMSKGWEAHETWWRTVEFAEAHTGIPLLRLMASGPIEALRRQRQAPVAVLAHSVGIYRAWRTAGLPLPTAATGHSMGFYAALVAASVVPLEATLDLIATVEDLCDRAFQDRPMAMGFVIGVTEMDLRQALFAYPDLVLSSRNGKAQFTISGPLGSLLPLLDGLRPEALKVGLLPVKHPMHGPHMAAILPPLARALSQVKPRDPAFPLISHFDGRIIQSGAEAWDEGLASIALPVDWLAVVERLKALHSPLLECGHGTQLAGLTQWAARDLVVGSLQEPPGESS
jgi:[acyl-carrier-protein] S-malonyltransferase